MADLTRKTAQLIPEFSRGSSSMANVNYEQIDSMTIRAYGELNGYTQQISQTSFTLQSGTYCLSLISTNSNTVFYPQLRSTDGQTTYRTGNGSFTLSEETIVVPRFAANTSTATAIDEKINLMLNEGSTAKPYEPHGWVHSLRKLTTATADIEPTIYSDGTAITAYTIKGNTVQSGTPTPSNPITISGVGNKTANLLDYSFVKSTQFATVTPITNGINLTGTYYAEIDIALEVGTTYYMSWVENVISGSTYVAWRLQYTDNTYSNMTRLNVALTPEKEIAKVLLYVNSSGTQASVDITYIMLNTGTAPLPYEPWGYKIPISSGQASAVNYLGSVQSTRQINKIVFDGTETGWDKGTYAFYYTINDMYIRSQVICTHYEYYDGTSSSAPTNSISTASGVGTSIWIKTADHDTTTLDQWKAYLQAQYAAGTPVTVYYVLATPTTGVVNEPLMAIGTYADSISNAVSIPTTEGANTITVDTTVQPSEFTATWTGWHDSSVKELTEQDYTPSPDSFVNTTTDTRDFIRMFVVTESGSTTIDRKFINIEETGEITISLTTTTTYERITVKHSGALRDIPIIVQSNVNGKADDIITFSCNVLGCNPTVEGGLSLDDMTLKMNRWE